MGQERAHAFPRRRASARFLVAATLSLGLLAACSPGGPSSTVIGHPAGDALVLRIHTEGGFLAPAARLTQLPGFSLFGDGRVIVPGAVAEIFPGPALPPLQVRRATESGIQAILREVASTGLFASSHTFDAARNFVMDAGTTVFTLHADGREVAVSIYALGTFDASNPPQAVPAGEIAAHRMLTRLSERLATVESWLPAGAWADAAWQPYRSDALRVVVRNADTDEPDQSGLGNQVVAWPIAQDPATFGDSARGGAPCGVVLGADAAAWLATLEKANQLTRFALGGHRYEVLPRPLLSGRTEELSRQLVTSSRRGCGRDERDRPSLE